jgi:hypothetical protein
MQSLGCPALKGSSVHSKSFNGHSPYDAQLDHQNQPPEAGRRLHFVKFVDAEQMICVQVSSQAFR